MGDIPDLWPSDIGEVKVIAPASVLREQAAHLAQKTHNLVIAVVESVTEKPNFIHSFVLTAPTLDGYSCRIFRVKHGLHFYPLEILTDIDGPNFRAASHDDLLRALGEIFSSAPVKKLVTSLIVQTRGLGVTETTEKARRPIAEPAKVRA